MSDLVRQMRDVFAAVDGMEASAEGMTAKHIFALLAYEHIAEVRGHFDRRFGDGAAARILSQVQRPPTAANVAPQVHIPAPIITVQVPDAPAPQVIVQSVDHERLAALEQQIADLRKPRKIRVTQRDVNGNILELEQRAET